MSKPQKDFYEAVQPFQKDISDLKLHFSRRDALHRQLGLPPRLLGNQSIIEFGPGHGENALFTLLQGPRRFVLVDANKPCLDYARNLLEPNRPPATELEWHLAEIETFPEGEQFDMVICEGTIPYQIDPLHLLHKVASYVKPGGGLLNLTCLCPVSQFSEILRRVVALFVTEPADSLEIKADKITPILTSHLATLKGMARSHRFWVMDNMIHPWNGKTFSIRDGILALKDFDLYGTSPRFLVDLRWFREIHGDARHYAQRAEDQWLANLINLIDYRVSLPPTPVEIGLRLVELCDAVFADMNAFEATRDLALLDRIRPSIAGVAETVNAFSPATATAISDYLKVFDAWRTSRDSKVLLDFGTFTGFFGRGQQYATFIRN